jgi:hypothetical protein
MIQDQRFIPNEYCADNAHFFHYVVLFVDGPDGDLDINVTPGCVNCTLLQCITHARVFSDPSIDLYKVYKGGDADDVFKQRINLVESTIQKSHSILLKQGTDVLESVNKKIHDIIAGWSKK